MHFERNVYEWIVSNFLYDRAGKELWQMSPLDGAQDFGQNSTTRVKAHAVGDNGTWSAKYWLAARAAISEKARRGTHMQVTTKPATVLTPPYPHALIPPFITELY